MVVPFLDVRRRAFEGRNEEGRHLKGSATRAVRGAPRSGVRMAPRGARRSGAAGGDRRVTAHAAAAAPGEQDRGRRPRRRSATRAVGPTVRGDRYGRSSISWRTRDQNSPFERREAAPPPSIQLVADDRDEAFSANPTFRQSHRGHTGTMSPDQISQSCGVSTGCLSWTGGGKRSSRVSWGDDFDYAPDGDIREPSARCDNRHQELSR